MRPLVMLDLEREVVGLAPARGRALQCRGDRTQSTDPALVLSSRAEARREQYDPKPTV
jgi:hypothetical protein